VEHRDAGMPAVHASQASQPYLETAKARLKECFSLPCLDTICAMLAISNCSQILNDVTSAFMYANIASGMVQMAGNIPPEIRHTCEFLTKIRSNYSGPLPPAAADQDGHERFVQITAHIMQCFRAWHSKKEKWYIVKGQGTAADTYDAVFKLIEEAEAFLDFYDTAHCRAGSLRPACSSAARLWMLAARGRFHSMKGEFVLALPYLQEFAQKAVERPMADHFSLYACYSIAFSLQYMKVKGGIFDSLWVVLGQMAQVWPLAETLVQLLKEPLADSGSWQEATLASLQGLPPQGSPRVSPTGAQSIKIDPSELSEEDAPEPKRKVRCGQAPPGHFTVVNAPPAGALYRLIPVEQPQELQGLLRTAVRSSTFHKVFVLFTAQITSDGFPWCSDCINAEPVIFDLLAKVEVPIAVLMCRVAQAEWNSTARHPYTAMAGLERLPTLILWGSTGPLQQLVEAECKYHERVQRLLQGGASPGRASREGSFDEILLDDPKGSELFEDFAIEVPVGNSTEAVVAASAFMTEKDVHTKEEYGVPSFSEQEASTVSKLIHGILDGKNAVGDELFEDFFIEVESE